MENSQSPPVELVGLQAQVLACERMLSGLRAFEDDLCREDSTGELDTATLALCRSSLWQAAATLSAELFRLKARVWELDQLKAVLDELQTALSGASGSGLFSVLGGLSGLFGGGRRGKAESAPCGPEGD